jgi:hypothetical protein
VSDGTEIGSLPKQKRKRGNPAWVKGGPSPNPTGRPGGYEEFRATCKTYSTEALTALRNAIAHGDVQAARVLLEYAWGKPSSAPEDLEAVVAANPLAGLTLEQLLVVASRAEEE